MFTGLIEEVGTIRSFTEHDECWKLVIEAHTVTEDIKVGDSIAVNGCCLTVVGIGKDTISFDLLEETVRLTSFHSLASGRRINLERAVAVGKRMGGHFVSGHIDLTGELTVFERRGKNFYIETKTDPKSLRYLIYKGSISIDGISLTVAEVLETGFSVWIIPHTLEHTHLHDYKTGSIVNLEFDLLAKYTESIILDSKKE